MMEVQAYIGFFEDRPRDMLQEAYGFHKEVIFYARYLRITFGKNSNEYLNKMALNKPRLMKCVTCLHKLNPTKNSWLILKGSVYVSGQ